MFFWVWSKPILFQMKILTSFLPFGPNHSARWQSLSGMFCLCSRSCTGDPAQRCSAWEWHDRVELPVWVLDIACSRYQGVDCSFLSEQYTGRLSEWDFGSAALPTGRDRHAGVCCWQPDCFHAAHAERSSSKHCPPHHVCPGRAVLWKHKRSEQQAEPDCPAAIRYRLDWCWLVASDRFLLFTLSHFELSSDCLHLIIDTWPHQNLDSLDFTEHNHSILWILFSLKFP